MMLIEHLLKFLFFTGISVLWDKSILIKYDDATLQTSEVTALLHG